MCVDLVEQNLRPKVKSKLIGRLWTASDGSFLSFSDMVATGKSGIGSKVRQIESDDPLKTAHDFFNRATKGAIARGPLIDKNKNIVIPHAEVAIMVGGGRIQIREYSHSDGSPAIDIQMEIPGVVKRQKIHFTLKGDKS